MVAQLSTSGRFRQLTRLQFVAMLVFFLVQGDALAQGSGWQQPSEIEQRIDPLSPIDEQFMAAQRTSVEVLANRMGRRLTLTPDRDIDTLQEILNRQLVASDDELTLQAMGMVLGDLLAKRLDMDWVVYRDRAGRSRALRYRETDVFLFPVTMISRRYGAGNQRPVQDIYDTVVDDTLPKLPGARWR